jgi:hypothetical protein
VELRAWHRSLVDGELLAQGQVLESELAMAAEEEGEEPEQVEYEGDHGRDCGRAGRGRQINHLASGEAQVVAPPARTSPWAVDLTISRSIR